MKRKAEILVMSPLLSDQRKMCKEGQMKKEKHSIGLGPFYNNVTQEHSLFCVVRKISNNETYRCYQFGK